MNFKEKIANLIESYKNSSLKAIVDSKIISAAKKIIYRSVGVVTEKVLNGLVQLREKFEAEEDPEKKSRHEIGLKLSAAFLGHVGNVFIEARKILLGEDGVN